jgi:hypothetical protein
MIWYKGELWESKKAKQPIGDSAMRRLRRVGVLLLAIALPGCGDDDVSDESEDARPAMTWVPSSELRSTDVVPHTDVKITPGRNLVYCSTFQMAWSELQNEIIGEPIRLTGSPPMADSLNAGRADESDLPADSYLVHAGMVKDGILDEIRREMQERFPDATLKVPDSAEDDPYAIISYAYLAKSLPFEERFDSLRRPLTFLTSHGGVSVEAFGIEPHSPNAAKLRSQIHVMDYQGPDDFILELETREKEDQLVLAKIPPGETLGAMIQSVEKRIADGSAQQPIIAGERFEVPNVSLAVIHKYSELIGRSLLNEKYGGYVIAAAEHAIGFGLDAVGARVESHGYLQLTTGKSRHVRREFIFNRPFLIYLKRRDGQRPYLVIWIETQEVLQPAGD